MRREGIIKQYRPFLNLPEHMAELSLGEGNTPLIRLGSFNNLLGSGFELYAKFEGLNPTGSFKDRGMVAAIAEAAGKGARVVMCASTGNTLASAAAYARRAGISPIGLIPEGKVARGKIVAAAAHGARMISIEGSFDQALSLVQKAAKKLPVALVNSVNPYRLEGQKTAAFEICDELGQAPDILLLPVGNAGNITAYHMGFSEYDQLKRTGMPRLIGVQAEGASPLVTGKVVPVLRPETIASAIRIGNPARGREALRAVKQSGGKIISVSDAEILDARTMLAHEGIFAEPASAAGLAGLIKEWRAGLVLEGKRIVVVVTGHGLKDPDSVQFSEPVVIKPTLSALEKELG